MIGTVVSHYRIEKHLGSGGSGDVYLARDAKLDREVAIKFLNAPQPIDPDAERRFLTEARALSALDHPGIGVVHEIDRTAEGRLYMVMAYYDGGSLRERIDRDGLTVPDAVALMKEIAGALGAAHGKGMVHRDVKPGNIVFNTAGEAKLIDFGLARLSDQITLTRTGSSMGTVAYMSPEQVMCRPLDRRSDLFSLGVVFFEMLTGTLPFASENEAAAILGIVGGRIPSLDRYLTPVPPRLQEIIDRLLAKDPARRFFDCDELLSELDKLESGLTGGFSTQAHLASRFRRLTRGRRARWFAAAAVVLPLVFSLWILRERLPRIVSNEEAFPPAALLVHPDGAGRWPSIQAAINAAADGDSVLLADGIFRGAGNRQIGLSGKRIVLASRSGDPRRCIIDCEGGRELSQWGLAVTSGEKRTTVIRDITIRNAWRGYDGGALRIKSSSPSIVNCHFVENGTYSAKGQGIGGAIGISSGSDPLVRDCLFIGNYARDCAAAIHVSNSAGEIRHCRFENNYALHGGSAIFCVASQTRISHCLFRANSCGPGHWGSSLHFDRGGADAIVEHCTFRDDHAPGEVVFARRGAAPQLRNCLIAHNGPGAAVFFHEAGIDIRSSNIFGNRGGDWTGPIAAFADTLGNMSRDPGFCNCPGAPTGVAADSPCLAGNNPAGADIGLISAVAPRVGRKRSVPDEYATIRAALADAAAGDTVWIAAGRWSESPLRMPAGVSLIGATGDPADVVLDGGGRHPLIHCERLPAGIRIEALTLRDGVATGTAPAGGAVSAVGSDLSISNCVISGCSAVDGGGICISDTDMVEITDCLFRNNAALTAGGGLLIDRCLSSRISGCRFVENTSDWHGGGLHLRRSSASVDSCLFRRNSASHGAAASTDRSQGRFRHCLLHANSYPSQTTATLFSSVLSLSSGSDMDVVNCTFAGSRNGSMGAVITTQFSRVSVLRTIISGSESGCAYRDLEGGTIVMACCDVHGNRDGDFEPGLERFAGVDGNLNSDPLFSDAKNDRFALRPESPCAPGGTNGGCGLIGAYAVAPGPAENQDRR